MQILGVFMSNRIWILLKKLSFCIFIISALAGLFAFVMERVEPETKSHKPYGIYEKNLKRPFDAFLATGAIIVLLPVLAVTAICVKVKLGSPIIFGQDRPGRDERLFKLYKFRTMTNQHDKDGKLLSDDERITAFGKVLRSTSLDELPELVNIIKGDMAIVGPRPLLKEYLPYYTNEEKRRHDIRPGLTGWAQINGRNAINSWEERFKYDLEYVDHISMAMDLKILFNTIYKVIRRSDIYVGSEIKAGRLDVARSENNHT